jgi:hypothetical protein
MNTLTYPLHNIHYNVHIPENILSSVIEVIEKAIVVDIGVDRISAIESLIMFQTLEEHAKLFPNIENVRCINLIACDIVTAHNPN